MFILTITLIVLLAEAKSKGDMYIIGGKNGILYKSYGKHGKKGELIIMGMNTGGDHDDDHVSYSQSYMYPMSKYYGY